MDDNIFEADEYTPEYSSETDRYSEVFSKYNLNVDEESVKKAVSAIRRKSAAYGNEQIMKLIECLDYTSLKTTDSEETVMAMTETVNDFFNKNPEIPSFAAICTYPCYAETVSSTLEIDGISIACVSGGFPSSQTSTEIKIAETAMAVHDGAEEIDIVLPVGRFLSGEYEYIADEIQELKSVCGDKILKVILETGSLGNMANVRKASVMAVYSGADFIKTSTGKEAVGATPEAFYVMCQFVKEYAETTGTKIGVKAAGGISTIEDAFLYYAIVENVLGKEWISKTLFRIGASKLAGNLISQLTGEKSPF